MPRRRPSTLRAKVDVSFLPRSRYSKIGRISGAAQSQVILLERTRFRPGSVATSLARWTDLARTPRGRRLELYSAGCGEPGCCPPPGDDRDLLEYAVRAMPRKSARELRAILDALDEAIMSHPDLAHSHVFRGRWWLSDI